MCIRAHQKGVQKDAGVQILNRFIQAPIEQAEGATAKRVYKMAQNLILNKSIRNDGRVEVLRAAVDILLSSETAFELPDQHTQKLALGAPISVNEIDGNNL